MKTHNILASAAEMPAEESNANMATQFLANLTFQNGLLVAAIATVAGLLCLGAFAAMTGRGVSRHSPHHWLSKILYVGFIFAILALALSSFSAILVDGHMLGYPLLAHIAAAGGFVFLLLAFALLYLPRGRSRHEGTEHRWWLARLSAWVLVTAGVVTAATMFVSMLPILGTDGLHEAVEIHRWAGLAVVVAATFHLFSLLITRLGLR